MNRFFFLLILSFISAISASLNCTQIPDSQIFDGSSFYFPFNSNAPTEVPTNFNCTYTISAPVRSSDVLYGVVILHNMLGGYVDRMVTVDSMGFRREYTSDDDAYFSFEVFPGRPMTVQIITSDSNASSKFSLHVSYHRAKIGATTKLKSGGNMNFVDLSTIAGDQSASSVTVVGNEQMSVTVAMATQNWPENYLDNVYLIDGDFFNQLEVHRLSDIAVSGEFSTTNNVTIVHFQNTTHSDVAVVLNRISEVKDLGGLISAASTQKYDNPVYVSGGEIRKNAVQILDVQSRKIKMKHLSFNGTIPSNCVAQVVTGPPNEYSQLLLDLTKSVDLMPYTFNLKYFSILAQNCDFSFTVSSP